MAGGLRHPDGVEPVGGPECAHRGDWRVGHGRAAATGSTVGRPGIARPGAARGRLARGVTERRASKGRRPNADPLNPGPSAAALPTGGGSAAALPTGAVSSAPNPRPPNGALPNAGLSKLWPPNRGLADPGAGSLNEGGTNSGSSNGAGPTLRRGAALPVAPPGRPAATPPGGLPSRRNPPPRWSCPR